MIEMDESDTSEQTAGTWWRLIALIALVIMGALVGLLLSQIAAPRPKVGIVRLYDVIDYFTAPYYFGPLRIASERRDIAAVVLLIDSPGGDATVSEELFYRISRLREDKPIVASIERFGASGAYYAAVGTNYIFARPAAQVGSIGVIASFPDQEPPDEETLFTGPFKGSGQSDTEFMRDIEAIKETFITHVYDQRRYVLENMHTESYLDRLPPRDALTTGQIWTGARAYEIGLIDELGSNEDAIAMAARLAGIRDYEIIDLYTLFINQNPEVGEYIGVRSEDRPDWYTTGPWAELYHLYVVTGN